MKSCITFEPSKRKKVKDMYYDLIITDLDKARKSNIISYCPVYSGDLEETPKNNSAVLFEIELRNGLKQSVNNAYLINKGIEVINNTEEEVNKNILCPSCNGEYNLKGEFDFKEQECELENCEHCNEGFFDSYEELFSFRIEEGV